MILQPNATLDDALKLNAARNSADQNQIEEFFSSRSKYRMAGDDIAIGLYQSGTDGSMITTGISGFIDGFARSESGNLFGRFADAGRSMIGACGAQEMGDLLQKMGLPPEILTIAGPMIKAIMAFSEEKMIGSEQTLAHKQERDDSIVRQQVWSHLNQEQNADFVKNAVPSLGNLSDRQDAFSQQLAADLATMKLNR